eukprot:4994068-Pleurochrysis_carterae.AAC.1
MDVEQAVGDVMEGSIAPNGLTADTTAQTKYVPSLEHYARAVRMSDGVELALALTIVVTTSPIPSNPSTGLLETVFSSLKLCTGNLLTCKVVLVCDSYKISNDDQACRYKQGQVTRKAAEAYEEFLQCVEHDAIRMPANLKVIRLRAHHGFGRALRVALETEVTTRLVLVVQHDWVFMPPGFDVGAAADIMLRHPLTLPYVAAMSLSTADYVERVKRRYQLDITSAVLQHDSYYFIPLIMLQDKPFLASRTYLLDFVLGPDNCPAVGQFPEDTLGRKQLALILAEGISTHTRYKTFVLDQGGPVVYHLSGRKVHAGRIPSETSAAVVALSPLSSVRVTQSDAAASSAGFVRGAAWSVARVSGLALPSGEFPRGHGQASQPKGRFKGRCFMCGVKGHSKEYCSEGKEGATAAKASVVLAPALCESEGVGTNGE